MKLLNYKELAQAPGMQAKVSRLMQSPVMQGILADSEVPEDCDAPKRREGGTYPGRQAFEYTPGNSAGIATLMVIAAENPILLASDLDGTGAQFAVRTEDSRLAGGLVEGALRINHAHELDRRIAPSFFLANTGRMESDLRHIASQPQGYTIMQAGSGRVLRAADDANLAFPGICGRGTLYVEPSGLKRSITLSGEELGFVQRCHEAGLSLRADYPALELELKESGLGIKDMSGRHLEAVRRRFAELVADSPKSDGKPAFSVPRGEGANELAIVFTEANKRRALKEFVLDQLEGQHPGLLLMSAGDSFEPTCTDHAVGRFIHENDGAVVQVLNDRDWNVGHFNPDVTIPNPRVYSRIVRYIGEQKERQALAAKTQGTSLQLG